MINFGLAVSYHNLKFCEQTNGQSVKNVYFTVSNYSFTVEIDKKIITSSRSHELQFEPKTTQNRHWKLGQHTISVGTILAYLETTA